jgi:GPH family glycoside/pentoside/hexuronide:cation symporter
MPSATTTRLRFLEKAGYALGDAASNFYWKLFEVYVVFYYTDVFGLAPATLGTMMLVTRLWDAVADPVMGVVADRTSTRFGKFRPYLLWFALPLAFSGILAFSVPSAGGSGRLVYAYATYTLLMLAYTAINIPYSALMGVMTPSSAERTDLSSYRFVGAFLGGLLVQKFSMDLVRVLGQGNPARGWQLTLALYGLVATCLFFLSFAATRERVAVPEGQTTNLRRDLVDLLGNRPWRALFGVGVLVIASAFLRGSAAAYYFKYHLHREDLVGWFFATSGLAAIAGVLLTGALTRRFGKRTLYRAVLAIAGLLTAVFYFVPPDCLWLVFGLNALIALVLGPNAPLLWAMYADTADHAEWETGRRTTGLVFAAAIFALKLGGALGGWALGQLLQAFGYAPNVEQSAQAVLGIRLVMSFVPGALLLGAAGMLLFYEIDDVLVRRIEQDLVQARASRDSQRSTPDPALVGAIAFDTGDARS